MDNYKGFFYLVLLAMVDAEYRFLWIDCGSSGLCSDTQIFNGSLLRENRVVENAFGILDSCFRVLLVTMELRPMVIRDIVFTFVVLHNMLRTHTGVRDRAPTPRNDVVPTE